MGGRMTDSNRGSEAIELRLGRIEDALLKLTDVMTSIARIEEQIKHVYQHIDVQWKRLERLEGDCAKLVKAEAVASQSLSFGRQLFFLILGSGLTILAGLILHLIKGL
jgi:hypothetical protein